MHRVSMSTSMTRGAAMIAGLVSCPTRNQERPHATRDAVQRPVCDPTGAL